MTIFTVVDVCGIKVGVVVREKRKVLIIPVQRINSAISAYRPL